MLAAEALGSEQVLGIMMPYKNSSAESLEHGRLVVEKSSIRSRHRGDHGADRRLLRHVPGCRPQAPGQQDGPGAYDHPLRPLRAVGRPGAGTSNKTELLLGYGTLHGDMASALNPLGDLYKTQVWALSEAVGVPDVIVNKKPSADLWAGQTDEAELGFSYRAVDELLYLMVDQRYGRAELIEAGFEPDFVDDIARRIMTSQFKRRLPIIAKVSHRTIDRDFRYSRDWGK